jgi:hypothetical protein
MQRREFIQLLGAGAAATTLVGCASTKIDAKNAKVLVIGGGYGGGARRAAGRQLVRRERGGRRGRGEQCRQPGGSTGGLPAASGNPEQQQQPIGHPPLNPLLRRKGPPGAPQ